MKTLQELFAESGITLVELSKKSGVSICTCRKYVKGNTNNIKSKYYTTVYETLQNLHPSKDVINQNMEYKNNQVSEINVEELKGKMMENGISKPPQVQSYSTYNTSQNKKTPQRGEIWYISNMKATGSEVWNDRPAIILSLNKLNNYIGTVMVVYLTTQQYQESPFHVTVKTNKPSSIAICEKVNTISVNKLMSQVGKVSDIEMNLIEKAVSDAMGIKRNSIDFAHSNDYLVLQTENRLLREFNEKLVGIAKK